MGTNFYLQEQPPCECCKRPYEQRHIGKSSGGWYFALHVYPEEGINDLRDWKLLFSAGVIVDEYSRKISVEEMLDLIINRKWQTQDPSHWTSEELRRNHAELGLNGLVRSTIDGFCIKHGEGTWDCIVGDFS